MFKNGVMLAILLALVGFLSSCGIDKYIKEHNTIQDLHNAKASLITIRSTLPDLVGTGEITQESVDQITNWTLDTEAVVDKLIIGANLANSEDLIKQLDAGLVILRAVRDTSHNNKVIDTFNALIVVAVVTKAVLQQQIELDRLKDVEPPVESTSMNIIVLTPVAS